MRLSVAVARELTPEHSTQERPGEPHRAGGLALNGELHAGPSRAGLQRDARVQRQRAFDDAQAEDPIRGT
jgi:hypothetical protein